MTAYNITTKIGTTYQIRRTDWSNEWLLLELKADGAVLDATDIFPTKWQAVEAVTGDPRAKTVKAPEAA